VEDGEDLSYLEDGSVDVLTCAMAMHWFNEETFYPQVKRVLKPGGVLAVFGYRFPEITPKGAKEVIHKVSHDHTAR